MRSLDQVVETAPLVAGYRDSELTFVSWAATVTLALQPGDSAATILSTGPLPDERTDQLLFGGPTRGAWLLRIHALPSSGMPASHHWLLEVPPRPMPSDGHIDATPPDLIASDGAASVVAELGSACYVQTCADRTVEPTILRPGITLTDDAALDLTLSDGSGMTAWVVAIRPPGDPYGQTVDVLAHGGEAGVDGIELPTPPTGVWVLEVRVRFDLERGDATYYLRVTVPSG